MPSPTMFTFAAHHRTFTMDDALDWEPMHKHSAPARRQRAVSDAVARTEESRHEDALDQMLLDTQEGVIVTEFSDCGDLTYSSSYDDDDEEDDDDDMYSYVDDEDDDDDHKADSATVLPTTPRGTKVMCMYGQNRACIPLRYAGASWIGLPGAMPLQRTNTSVASLTGSPASSADVHAVNHRATGLAYRPAGRALGSGSGGSVTLYHRERDGIPVAVKRFASARVGESLQHRRNKVDAEIRMLCTLDHPNIMSALDVIELSEAEDTPTRRVVSNGMRYSADTRTVKLLVTECFPSDLFSTVEGNLSSSETRRLFYQLLSAVAHMHERGIAHRDLKLENICMDRHGSLKVIDLGNAIRIRAGQYSSKALSFGVYGSDPYVPPEAWRSLQWWMTMVNGGNPMPADEVDVTAKLAGAGYNPFHADLWALGILLIAMTQKSFAWWRAETTDAGFSWFSAHRSAFLQTFPEPWQRVAIDALLRECAEERMSAAQLLEQLQMLEAHEATSRGFTIF